MRAVVFFLFTLAGTVSAQDSLRFLPQVLVVRAEDRTLFLEIAGGRTRSMGNDSTFQVSDTRALLLAFHEKGYLGASIDPIQSTDSVSMGRLFVGPKLYWVEVQPASPLVARWLDVVRGSEALRPGKVVSVAQLRAVQRSLLSTLEDNGYPFARIWLDSLLVEEGGGVRARLQMDLGAYYRYQSLKINGDIRISRRFLERHLSILPGKPYSHRQLMAIRRQLSALPYLESYAAPTVTFLEDQAIVNVWLKKKPAGRFDFLLGLLPQTGELAGRTLLTGSLNGLLWNAFGWGERFSVEIDRLRPETQKMEVQVGVPLVGGSPLGAEGSFHLFRRDSTWVDAQGKVGIQVQRSSSSRLVFFVENRSSFLQKIDTNVLIQRQKLPDNLDYRQQGLGLEASWTRLDAPLNPRKGWSAQALFFAGQHQVRRNPQIESLPLWEGSGRRFSELYDAVTDRQSRFRVEGRSELFVPVGKVATVLVRAQGAALLADGITRNEQYRLGGNRRLRGFDEEFLLATRWAMTTLEARLLLGNASYLAAFWDAAYIENKTGQVALYQRPMGLGIGLNLETAGGVFGISAAVGRLDDTGFDFRATKIHLGYVGVPR